MRAMLLSIKPIFVEEIFAGNKQFEFRKKRCRSDVTRIVFYATSPMKQVVGEADIGYVLEDTLSNVWSVTKHAAGISKTDFNRYYAGSKTAVAYYLKNVIAYDTPHQLSNYGVNFPPQSFVYVDLV